MAECATQSKTGGLAIVAIVDVVLELTSADIASQSSGLDGRAMGPNKSVNADAQCRPTAFAHALSGRRLLLRWFTFRVARCGHPSTPGEGVGCASCNAQSNSVLRVLPRCRRFTSSPCLLAYQSRERSKPVSGVPTTSGGTDGPVVSRHFFCPWRPAVHHDVR